MIKVWCEIQHVYLKKAWPEWNNCDNNEKRIINVAVGAVVWSLFEVTPSIVTDVELQTPEGLNL